MAIKCPKCQADNADTARFYINCATQLTPAGQPFGTFKVVFNASLYKR
jgi:hypothetical protein